MSSVREWGNRGKREGEWHAVNGPASYSALQEHFQRYFPKDYREYDWIRDPFSATPPDTFSTAEEEELIDVTSDSTLRLQFKSKTLDAFWIGVEKDYPLLGRRALAILLPFATSYLCKIGFSAVASIKTKYRSKLDIENELRVAISHLQPWFERICNMKQAHPSHWKGVGIKAHIFAEQMLKVWLLFILLLLLFFFSGSWLGWKKLKV